MQAEELITEGDVWRGIGPQVSLSGNGAPYERRDEDGREVVIFSAGAFYSPAEHNLVTEEISQQPSMLLAQCAGQPREALATLEAAGLPCAAIAGISVPAILSVKGRPSPGEPTLPGSNNYPSMMIVVYDPTTVTNRNTGREVRIEAHVVIRSQPRWHNSRGPFKLIQRTLAELATRHHRVNGWVVPPSAEPIASHSV